MFRSVTALALSALVLASCSSEDSLSTTVDAMSSAAESTEVELVIAQKREKGMEANVVFADGDEFTEHKGLPGQDRLPGRSHAARARHDTTG